MTKPKHHPQVRTARRFVKAQLPAGCDWPPAAPSARTEPLIALCRLRQRRDSLPPNERHCACGVTVGSRESVLTRNQSHNHAVQVVEEADEVEAELDERLLLVRRQRAEDFCRVIHVVFGHDPAHGRQFSDH